MNSFYKYCMVPQCKSTTIKTPNKLFIYVPNNAQIRKKWFTLARRYDGHCLSTKSSMYFCEDHFDLPNVMENYIEYRLMGSVSQIRLKAGCLPTKFGCQPDRKRRTDNERTRPLILKKQRLELTAQGENDIQKRISMIEVQPRLNSATTDLSYTDLETQNPEEVIITQNENALDHEYLPPADHHNENGEQYVLQEAIDIDVDIKCEPVDSYPIEYDNSIENTDEMHGGCENENDDVTDSNCLNNRNDTLDHTIETVGNLSSETEARTELLRVQIQAAHAELELKKTMIKQQELEHKTRMHYLQREGILKVKLLEERLKFQNKGARRKK